MGWPELPWLLPWYGLIWTAVYYGVAMVIEDAFVISSYRMYSPTADRQEGAIPAFFAGDGEARLIDYTGFTGIDPDAIRWDGYACAHQWMVHEARRWVLEHRAMGEGTQGGDAGVEVVWGFKVFTVSPEGHVQERFDPIVRGRAVRR